MERGSDERLVTLSILGGFGAGGGRCGNAIIRDLESNNSTERTISVIVGYLCKADLLKAGSDTSASSAIWDIEGDGLFGWLGLL